MCLLCEDFGRGDVVALCRRLLLSAVCCRSASPKWCEWLSVNQRQWLQLAWKLGLHRLQAAYPIQLRLRAELAELILGLKHRPGF